MLWWGKGKLSSRQWSAVVLNLLVDWTGKDGLRAGNLTHANTNIHILKVTWHVPYSAPQWLGIELGRGEKAVFSLTGPSVRLWAVGWWQPAPLQIWALCICKVLGLCVTSASPQSLGVCVSQTATDHHRNQTTAAWGCTFTDFQVLFCHLLIHGLYWCS